MHPSLGLPLKIVPYLIIGSWKKRSYRRGKTFCGRLETWHLFSHGKHIMTLIITCGETRQSLSAVRAIGRAQIPVAAGAAKRPALAMWSRYATSTFLTEDPSINARKFAEQLAQELRARYAICALVGTDDA